jgi:hypothetical protein
MNNNAIGGKRCFLRANAAGENTLEDQSSTQRALMARSVQRIPGSHNLGIRRTSTTPETVAKSPNASKRGRKRQNARRKKVANSAVPTQSGGAATKSVRPAQVPSVDADRGGMQDAVQAKMSNTPERGVQQITSNSTSCAVEPVGNGLNPIQTGLKPIINNHLRFVSTDAMASASRNAALLARVRLQSIDPRRVVAKGRGGRTSASAHGGAGDE